MKNHENVTDDMVAGSVYLRFWHPTEDLTFLSSLLDLKRDWGWRAGAPRTTPKGTPLSGKYKESYWLSNDFEFAVSQGFQEQLINAVNHLVKVEKEMLKFIDSEGTIEVYLQLEGDVHHGGEICSDILSILGRMGVRLAIEVFPFRRR
ncbi:hypothetical protein LJC47_05245 [Desulfosarcina sp. OttesenSCG-928-B08]|nr:hypothetical protein [Desulfosarcina sp. OttesenSCG-928-B08]